MENLTPLGWWIEAAVAGGRKGGSWRRLPSGWRQASNMQPQTAGRERRFETAEIADALPSIDPHNDRHEHSLRRSTAARSLPRSAVAAFAGHRMRHVAPYLLGRLVLA
jgi:hypothetical protein